MDNESIYLQSAREVCLYPPMNLTDESIAEVFLLNSLTSKSMMVTMFIILAFGVPGNLAFIFVVFRVQSMRSATNMYLTSLAIIDLTFLFCSIFSYYFYLNNNVRTHLVTAEAVGCIGAFTLPYFTYFLSVSTVTLVTLDRCNAVCNPLGYIQRCNKLRAMRLIIASWVVAFFLSSLVCLRYAKLVRFCVLWPDADEYKDLPDVLGYCTSISPAGKIIGHTVEVVVFVLALIANSIMYARIILRLNARVNSRTCQQQTVSSQAVQIRNQVSRLLITFGTVFFLCQSPFVIINLAYIVEYFMENPFHVTYGKLVIPLTISHVFVFLNSAINPIIYNLTSRIYRQAFKQVVCCSKDRDQRLSTSSDLINRPDNLQSNGFENAAQAEELGLQIKSSKL